jgi:hemoglobin/transferrin/lactoferrin receptor protein
VVQSLVYGINYEVVDTERPRNRSETDTVTNETTFEIREYPMAAPEVFPNTTFPDTKTTQFGLFIQNEILLGDSGFTLIPGLRYDRIKMNADSKDIQYVADLGFDIESSDEKKISTNLGLIYELSTSSILFLQYAEGFRPPSYDEANQAFVNLAFNYAIVPNPNLNPETSQGFEIGYKLRIDKDFISFAVYDNHFKNFIRSQSIGKQDELTLYQDTNIGKVRIYGAEFMGVFHLSEQWKIKSSIAYSIGKDQENNTKLDQIEPLSLVFTTSYNVDSWEFQTSITLVDKKDDIAKKGGVTANGYGVIDLMGHYNFSEKVKLRIGVFNLFDKQYALWANIHGLDSNSDMSSIAKKQEPGREFRIAMSWQF